MKRIIQGVVAGRAPAAVACPDLEGRSRRFARATRPGRTLAVLLLAMVATTPAAYAAPRGDLGACCLPNGSCIETSAGGCATQQGAWQGLGTSCQTTVCPDFGACCLGPLEGGCTLITMTLCDGVGGTWMGSGTDCTGGRCNGACCLLGGACVITDVFICQKTVGGTFRGIGTECITDCIAACCLSDGTCRELITKHCLEQAGLFQGFGASCTPNPCPPPIGACCLGDGSCVDGLEQIECEKNLGGVWQGINTTCATSRCEGACCLGDGTCADRVTPTECTFAGGVYQGLGGSCTIQGKGVTCPGGACCLADGSCIDDTSEPGCIALGGTWQGLGTLCTSGAGGGGGGGGGCARPCCLPDGSCDTMTPDACLAAGGEPQGATKTCGTVRCPPPGCSLPGRPVPGCTDRVLRGYVLAWAIADVDSGEEIHWNHLSGGVTTVDYRDGWASEHAAFQVKAVAGAHGESLPTPGALWLDGVEYAQGYDQLLLNFQAAGSAAYSSAAAQRMVMTDTEVTLHPLSVDLRQDTVGPVTTKAKIDVWNENEVKFSGATRCVTCWDRQFLSRYALPNHFLRSNLQTDHGKARFDGVASPVCPSSVDAAILGVARRRLLFDGGVHHGAASSTLVGLGTEPGIVVYDVLAPPPESPDLVLEPTRRELVAFVDAVLGRSGSDAAAAFPSPGGAGDGPGAIQDVLSPAEKGSLVIFPAVELRWNRFGDVVRDTFVHLGNDFPGDVRVLMYFINGDPPLQEIDGAGTTCVHPGWNTLDNGITLTGNEPTYWSVLTGQPKGVSPFTALDP